MPIIIPQSPDVWDIIDISPKRQIVLTLNQCDYTSHFLKPGMIVYMADSGKVISKGCWHRSSFKGESSYELEWFENKVNEPAPEIVGHDTENPIE
jgi:hypothetical protein